MICKICGKEFKGSLGLPSHLRHNHFGYTVQKYYDEFFKTENEGYCRYCHKPTKFIGLEDGYNKYCSSKCANNDPEVREKFKQHCIEKYGVDNPNKSEKVLSKRKNTCMEKYGVDSFMKTTQFRDIAVNSSQSPEIKEKRKQTNQERYGVDYPFQSSIVQDTVKQHWLEIYGVDNVRKIPEIMQNKGNSHEARIKAANTRKKNGNNSSIEDYMEELLRKRNITYLKEYNNDNRYPFLCDFYLPRFDLFIECNCFPSHGGHWFNNNDKNDIIKLQEWQDKSHNNLYSSFIKTWTITDVRKRAIARENNLNYVVLWNKDDIDNWFSLDCPIGKDWEQEYTWLI